MEHSMTLPKTHVFHEHPKVTVIVPVYKVDRYLVQCLNSIVNQTMEELEIIIVDEGDHDRCREIIDTFAAKDPRIIAPHRKNGGYGASCNLGIKMARGEYLAIMESDDFIEPEMYEEMYDYAKALDADVVKTPFYEYSDSAGNRDCSYRQWITEETPQNQCFSMKEFGGLLHVHPSIWSGIYRRSYLHKNNVLCIEAKGAGYVDNNFRIKTLISTENVAWLNKPYYHYRIDNEDASVTHFSMMTFLKRWAEVHEYFESRKVEYNKYYGPHLILEEYLNTLGWASKVEVNSNEWAMMERNFSHTSEDVIKKSRVFASYRRYRDELLAFKKNPSRGIKILKNLKRQIDNDAYGHLPMDSRFSFPWQEIMPGENIVLYGGGIVGKTFLRQVLMIPYCNVVAICDSNPAQTDINSNPISVGRIPVITLKELLAWDERDFDKIVIAIENKDVAESVQDDMVRKGIPSIKVKWYDPTIRTIFDLI